MSEPATVLIVDDSPLMLAMMQRSLRQSGYRLLTAHNGQEALELIAQERPDLVLLDVVLPDIDGLDICRRIKADPALADTYLLLISAPRGRPEDRTAGLEAGADGYLARPIAPRLLRAHVEAGMRLHQTLARVRAEHDLLASLIDVNPLGLIVVNRDGRIVRANPRAAALLDIPLERLIGADLAALQLRWHGLATDGSPLQSAVAPFQQALNTRQPVHGVRFEPPRRGDEPRLLVADAAPALDPDGEVEWVILTLRDITDVVSQLRRTGHLNTLLGAIRSINQLITRGQPPGCLVAQACDLLVASDVCESAWIALIDERGQVTSTAMAGASLTSQADATILSNRATWPTCTARALEVPDGILLWPEEHDPSTACAVCPWRGACDVALLASGDRRRRQQALAVRLEHQNRTYGVLTVTAWLETFTSPEEIDLLQEVAHDLGFALHDLETAAARRRAEMQVHMLASHIDDVIFRYSVLPEPHFDYLSPAVERLTGYSVEAWISNPDLLQQVFGKSLADLLQLAREARPGESTVLEHSVQHRDGRTLWVEIRATPVTDAQGQLIALEGIARDITERRQLELQLRQQERLAAVGQLAAGIAHDFNNIMSVIVLYSQMMAQQPELDEQTRTRLEVIYEQAHQASALVQQILDFSRSSELERHPMDLLAFTKETAKLLERVLPETIQITVGFEGQGFLIDGDPVRLQQVFMNLATNARDAMPRGGELRFTLRRVRIGAGWFSPAPELEPGEWVRLDVSDTGSGIPPEVLPHIFEPFFTTKPRGTGTGLGLAQVQGIVAQHGGTITVNSQVGSGTTFSIYLPALDMPPHRNATHAQDVVPQTWTNSGKHVLVVEDNELARTALADALAGLGYGTVAVPDGQQALDLLASTGDDIALVVSDAVMPDMGGLDLLQEMAQRGYQQPCIIVSGYLPPCEMERIKATPNYAGWLGKPLDLDALAGAIADALGPVPQAGI